MRTTPVRNLNPLLETYLTICLTIYFTIVMRSAAGTA